MTDVFLWIVNKLSANIRYGIADMTWTMYDLSTDFRVWAMRTDIVVDKVEIFVADIYAVLA